MCIVQEPQVHITSFPRLVEHFLWLSFFSDQMFSVEIWLSSGCEDDVLWGKLGTGGSLEGGGPTTIWSPHQFTSNLSHDCFEYCKNSTKVEKYFRQSLLFKNEKRQHYKTLEGGQMICIPHICHFWYATIFFRPVKGTPKKCVNSRQKLPRDKTA